MTDSWHLPRGFRYAGAQASALEVLAVPTGEGEDAGAIGAALWLSPGMLPETGRGVAGTATVLDRGEYLARIGDCVACHSVPGGRPFAGGRAMPTPFGNLYVPNITPDDETGIGRWSENRGGPLAASTRYLAEHPEFTIDPSCERYLMTYNPDGFLLRS
jgi:mono/diheme cytochrome c family protein